MTSAGLSGAPEQNRYNRYDPVSLGKYSDLFSFPSCSYINQRNRSWNIVESEKALVVSVNLSFSSMRSLCSGSWIGSFAFSAG